MGKEKEWFKAIREGHVSVIINFLNALKEKRPSKIKNLVKQLHSFDGTQSTALHLSCQYNHRELVRILLMNGASPNVLDQSGCTALHMAAWNGNEEICEIIMECSHFPVDVNTKNAAGETALHLACQHGHDKVVEILLELGADIEIPNSYDQTSLILACQYGRKDVVALLVERMSSERKQCLHYDSVEVSPMHMATHNGHAPVVAILIESGYPVNVQTNGGTCLHEAALWNRVPVVQTLLEHGIDETIVNADGKTALQILEKNNQKFGIAMKEMIQEYTEIKATGVIDAMNDIPENNEAAPPIKSRRGMSFHEDQRVSAVGQLGTVLSTSDDVEASSLVPQEQQGDPVRPSTPELMRRQSNKYRQEWEDICREDGDFDDDDVFGQPQACNGCSESED